MTGRAFLGELEQMVLLAILQRGTEAFGPGIAKELESRAGRELSRSALYSTLSRLEKKGLVEWEIEAAKSGSGGSRRRRFRVTASGLEDLRDAQEAFQALRQGLEELRRPSGG